MRVPSLARTRTRELPADSLFRRFVRIRDRCEVRLGFDRQIQRLEPGHGLVVYGVGHYMGKAEVIVVALEVHTFNLYGQGAQMREVPMRTRSALSYDRFTHAQERVSLNGVLLNARKGTPAEADVPFLEALDLEALKLRERRLRERRCSQPGGPWGPGWSRS